MVRKRVVINDPDFGPIELEDEGPPLSKIEKAAHAAISKIRSRRAWKIGKTYNCPSCRQRAFDASDDITLEFVHKGKVYVFAHMHGARCRSCGAQTVEAYEQIRMDDEVGVGYRSDYEAKVSRIGSGSLGTYWPKDIARLLHLKPDKKAFIEIVSPDAVMVRFREKTDTR